MKRRDAVRVAGAAVLGPLAVRTLSPSDLAGSDHKPTGPVKKTGTITQSVARWCYEDIPLPEFCRHVAEIPNLPAIDLLTVEEWAVAHDHGLTVSCGDIQAGTIEEGLNDVANHTAMLRAFEQDIPDAARLSVPNVICFFGNRRGMTDPVGIENSIRCLREAAPIAEAENVTILVEVLNSKAGGHVDYIGDHTGYALEVMRAVDSTHVKILYDIYHMQIMEGDIIRTITEAASWIGHYHTGGVPGRAEIDATQELNYPPIVAAIEETGFTGYMAHEFIPRSGDPIRSLREAVELCAQ